ncbi:MAG: hypothetical protein JO025_12330 [Verrucomicrobia bacterium]|nr:hypothetical protein [Verrucomicrobiota bacterium]
MEKSRTNLRVWLALLLVTALTLSSRAIEMRSSRQKACEHASKVCHSCCGDTPACHLAAAKLLPMSSTTSSPFSQPALLLPAVIFSIPVVSSNPEPAPAFQLVRDLWPPPREVLTRECILLL